MNGSEKPTKVTSNLKLWSITLPPRITGVQFGFGHTCGGAALPLTESDGIVRRPFFGEIEPVLLVTEKVVVCDSMGLFLLPLPGLKQSTVAENVAVRFAAALVFPTPAISNELQVTVIPVAAQAGCGVPVTRCAPSGPFRAMFATRGSGELRSVVGLVTVSEQAAAASTIRGKSRFMVVTSQA